MSSFPIPAMAGFPAQPNQSPPPPPDNFQYVKLPDGSYGKFDASASDDQIKQAISKDFPQAFQAPDPLANHPILSFLLGGAKQAAGAMFGSGMGQGGVLTQQPDNTQKPGSWNPFNSDYTQGASLANIPSNSVPDLKAMNPIGPALNNPNTAEGIGQSAVNLLLLRNMLSGRVPTFGSATDYAAKNAEVVQPLTRQPAQAAPATSTTPTPATSQPQSVSTAVAQNAWPPNGPTGVLQPSTKMSPAQLRDILETRSMQEAMREDLEQHGRSALSQEMRTFFARNAPGTPKTDLIQQAQQALQSTGQDTVMVKPEDFLNKTGTTSTANMNPQSIAQAKQAYSAGQDIEPPQITYDENGNVIGADGRHRAMGAAQAGVDRIPVRVNRVTSAAVQAAPPQSAMIQTTGDLINALRQMALRKAQETTK